MVLAVALRGLEIGLNFVRKIAQGRLTLGAMLPILVPVIRPEGEKDASGDEHDFDEEIQERPSMFSTSQAHARDYGRRSSDISSFQPEVKKRVLSSTFTSEQAAAGFPILCSNEVGAIDSFLVENSNGFTVEAGNISQLKQKLNKFTIMPNADLDVMSQKSFGLASKLTPEIWAEKLMSIINL